MNKYKIYLENIKTFRFQSKFKWLVIVQSLSFHTLTVLPTFPRHFYNTSLYSNHIFVTILFSLCNFFCSFRNHWQTNRPIKNTGKRKKDFNTKSKDVLSFLFCCHHCMCMSVWDCFWFPFPLVNMLFGGFTGSYKWNCVIKVLAKVWQQTLSHKKNRVLK